MPAGTLSTAGLGDVVPTTSAAKLFLACYAPLAVCAFARAVGAVALRPLDRARRRAQRAVLERYRGRLTPRTFDEVCSGPLVQKLGLSDNDATCTRDQFTLLTLVMQGKVSELDLDECRAAFAALDATRSGRLTTEDLEAWQQARQLRVESFLYRRRVRKLVRWASSAPLEWLQSGLASRREGASAAAAADALAQGKSAEQAAAAAAEASLPPGSARTSRVTAFSSSADVDVDRIANE